MVPEGAVVEGNGSYGVEYFPSGSEGQVQGDLNSVTIGEGATVSWESVNSTYQGAALKLMNTGFGAQVKIEPGAKVLNPGKDGGHAVFIATNGGSRAVPFEAAVTLENRGEIYSETGNAIKVSKGDHDTVLLKLTTMAQSKRLVKRVGIQMEKNSAMPF